MFIKFYGYYLTKISISILLFLFLFCRTTNAQLFAYNDRVFSADTTDYHKLNTNFAFHFYTGIKPGIGFGIEYPINGTNIIKPQFSFLGYSLYSTGKTNELLRQVLIQFNSGIYTHRKNHTGLFLNAILVLRHTNKKNWQLSIGNGPGFLKTFLPATYEYTETGLNKLFLPGRLFFTDNTELTLAKRIYLNHKPVDVFTKHSFYIILPYNHLVNFGYSIEWGFRIKCIKNPRLK